MARLIDVEPLDFISFQATGDTAYDQGFEDGVQFIAEKLDAAPTIDAIPVEWLRERKHWAAIDGDHWAENIISYLLEAWQKEQEARDAKM